VDTGPDVASDQKMNPFRESERPGLPGPSDDSTFLCSICCRDHKRSLTFQEMCDLHPEFRTRWERAKGTTALGEIAEAMAGWSVPAPSGLRSTPGKGWTHDHDRPRPDHVFQEQPATQVQYVPSNVQVSWKSR
jgi:hypothetical protein